jgi:glycosyltransferase involved in cell wall biosynthesis
LRLIYFTYGYSPHDKRFLRALAKTDHAVHYLPLINSDTERAPGEIPTEIKIEAPLQNSHSIGWIRNPGLIRKLREALERIQPDLVHAGPIHLAASLVALLDFHPLVSMSWGSDILWETRKPWIALKTRYTLARSDALVGDCLAVKKAAIRYGMDEDRITLFPWGVDLRHFSPDTELELRKMLGWEDKFILLSTRSFEPLYGVDLIIKAFIQLASEYPDLRLLLLGDGSQRAVFESWLNDAGLFERIHFAGMVDKHHLPNYYRSADVYVSASHSDGSSVSLLEAFACGVPALVSDIPGNCEWVEPGINGWRFLDGNLESLLTTLRTLLEDKDRLGNLGEAARIIAEKRANWDHNFPMLLEAYQMAVDHVSI